MVSTTHINSLLCACVLRRLVLSVSAALTIVTADYNVNEAVGCDITEPKVNSRDLS